MNRKWLILDCNFLCHRVKFSLRNLSYGETPTGVMFGFLKYLTSLQDSFHTSNFVFCWDSKTNKRHEIFPDYKRSRVHEDWTEEEIIFDREFRKQMKKLRKMYLPTIGFKNVFCQKGYESDDVIASVCLNLPIAQEAIIISSDHDLYQLIHHNISCYDPQVGKILTLQGFKKRYGIKPHEWAMVKALTGCSTDCVPGLKGIGEVTAIKYLTANLKESTQACQTIISKEGIRIYKRNIKLVQLPFKGIKKLKLRADDLSEQGWRQVIKELGIKSIKGRMPFGSRRSHNESKRHLI